MLDYFVCQEHWINYFAATAAYVVDIGYIGVCHNDIDKVFVSMVTYARVPIAPDETAEFGEYGDDSLFVFAHLRRC